MLYPIYPETNEEIIYFVQNNILARFNIDHPSIESWNSKINLQWEPRPFKISSGAYYHKREIH